MNAQWQLSQDPTYPNMKEYIDKLASAAEQGYTQPGIHTEGEYQLRQALWQKTDTKANQTKRQALSKVVAITSARLLKLKLEYNRKEAEKRTNTRHTLYDAPYYYFNYILIASNALIIH